MAPFKISGGGQNDMFVPPSSVAGGSCPSCTPPPAPHLPPSLGDGHDICTILYRDVHARKSWLDSCSGRRRTDRGRRTIKERHMIEREALQLRGRTRWCWSGISQLTGRHGGDTLGHTKSGPTSLIGSMGLEAHGLISSINDISKFSMCHSVGIVPVFCR